MSEMLLSEPFTRSEAHAAGVSSRKLAALIESGVVERPFAGVYLPAALGDTPEVRMRAMARLLPPGAALVRESAAWAHGIDVRPPDRFRAPPKLEVASPSSFDLNAVRRDGVHGHLLQLPPSDVTMVAGVPVTTAARTAVDLARYCEPYMGLAAVDMFCHRGLVDIDELQDRIARLAGQRWIGRARRICRLSDPRAESPGESWLRLRISESELPLPDLQIELRDAGGRPIYRLDIGYEEALLALEYDGIEYHYSGIEYSGIEQSARDARRQHAIRERWGWQTWSFHAGHVLGHRPVVEELIIDRLGLGVVPARVRWVRAAQV